MARSVFAAIKDGGIPLGKMNLGQLLFGKAFVPDPPAPTVPAKTDTPAAAGAPPAGAGATATVPGTTNILYAGPDMPYIHSFRGDGKYPLRPDGIGEFNSNRRAQDGNRRPHNAADISVGLNTTIPCEFPQAKVVLAKNVDGYGNTVILRIGSGANAVYVRIAHLNRIDVKLGDTVYKGQSIGVSGNTGNAKNEPAHIHYEIGKKNALGQVVLYDPMTTSLSALSKGEIPEQKGNISPTFTNSIRGYEATEQSTAVAAAPIQPSAPAAPPSAPVGQTIQSPVTPNFNTAAWANNTDQRDNKSSATMQMIGWEIDDKYKTDLNKIPPETTWDLSKAKKGPDGHYAIGALVYRDAQGNPLPLSENNPNGDKAIFYFRSGGMGKGPLYGLDGSASNVSYRLGRDFLKPADSEKSEMTLGSESWKVRLDPIPGQNYNGRGGFLLHPEGGKLGTHGCGGIMGEAQARQMREFRQKHPEIDTVYIMKPLKPEAKPGPKMIA